MFIIAFSNKGAIILVSIIVKSQFIKVGDPIDDFHTFVLDNVL